LQVAAVIPVHNRADLLARLLATLRAQTHPFTRLIVVDNGSGEEVRETAARAGCQIIPMGSNQGFARAVNRGWREAGEPWIAVLNSDVELDSHWLERLLQATDDSTGFATGTIFDAKQRTTIDGTYDLVSRAGCAWRAGHGEKRASNSAQPTEAKRTSIHIAPGTACLFRRNVLFNLGGYDESFGSYLEDVDLGLRCLRQGISGVFVPHAIAWHHGSATLGSWHPEVVRLISRNQLLLLSRHYDEGLLRRWFWPIVAGQLLWGVVAARHGTLFAWIRGKSEGLAAFRARGNPSPELRAFLLESEAEIRRRSKDSYWRWYFRLARAAH
jgi:GT2 family glycosyltransferase